MNDKKESNDKIKLNEKLRMNTNYPNTAFGNGDNDTEPNSDNLLEYTN